MPVPRCCAARASRAARGWSRATGSSSTPRSGGACSRSPRSSASRSERDHPRWPWTVEIETLLLVPVLDAAPPVEAIGVAARSMSQQSHIRITEEHYRRALEAIASVASAAMIDLRSDTVTLPTDAMRAAMAAAPLGDDQFGEDPSVNALQERVAALLGKQAGLFVPTGTMANQLPLKLYCQPGDDVVVGEESHAVWHETGAAAANAGVQFTTAGSGGLYTADELRAVMKPRGHLLFPPTTLVEVEDTQNRMGGLVWDRAELEAVAAAAREHGAASYLDGARLLNAAAARGDDPASLAAPFDLVSIALSKGLGCPGGSVLAGHARGHRRAHRYRRMLGGAMRQAGVLAAAGLYALDHHVDRLPEDHANARAIGERLAVADGVRTRPRARSRPTSSSSGSSEGAPDAATVVARARERGVLVMAFAARTVRAVTHLDVTAEDCAQAADVLADCVAG